MFNTLLCDLFLFQINIDFVSYADDYTPYCPGKSPEELITKLEESSRTISKWFENTDMKANPDKCHMLVSKNGSFIANIRENKISNTKTEKILGFTFETRLNFNYQVSNLCKKS